MNLSETSDGVAKFEVVYVDSSTVGFEWQVTNYQMAT